MWRDEALTKAKVLRAKWRWGVRKWDTLLGVKWVVDRIRPSGELRGNHDLMGVDTEASEQVFHIANRWRVVLSNEAPAHQELKMNIFLREHNVAHSCASGLGECSQSKGRVPE